MVRRRFLEQTYSKIAKPDARTISTKNWDHEQKYRSLNQLPIDYQDHMIRGRMLDRFNQKLINRYSLGTTEAGNEAVARNCVRRYVASRSDQKKYLPTWRVDGKWTDKHTNGFQSEVYGKMDHDRVKVSYQYLNTLDRLADEIADANRFFYVNNDSYYELRDSIRALADMAKDLGVDFINNGKGWNHLEPLVTRVQKACGQYILDHASARKTDHGKRRFEVAMYANRMLNPESAKCYEKLIMDKRNINEINYDALIERAGLNYQLKTRKRLMQQAQEQQAVKPDERAHQLPGN